jgi:DNA repair protein RecO (recombination protein O)
MRAYSAESLVLRTYRYGEADRIVVFLTEDRGKKRGAAPNATASRRRFGGALEPMTQGRVAYVEREHRDLVRLDRIELRRSPLGATQGRPVGDAAHVLGHAAYFAELLDEWAPESSPNERLFRLGSAVSEALCGGGSVEALARYFEYWLMRLEGVYPSLAGCPRCGRPLDDGAALVAADQAYVCWSCTPGGSRLSGPAVAFLRAAGTRTPADVGRDTAPLGLLREIESVHHALLGLHLEREPRSAKIVRELRPES